MLCPHHGPRGSASGEPTVLDGLPTVVLPISSLLLNGSPRQDGANDEHAQALAESEEQLPPIVVHHQSMRVIDGIHRIRAAVLRGKEEIAAKIYHGTDNEAFMLAVRLNIAHGLPLTRVDRIAAAIRIIGWYPMWSNRMIALASGLSAGTISKLRRCSTEQDAQSTTRMGKDGRLRPVNSATGRRKAGELLAEKPTASIRAIAKEAGVSPSTVHDVRRRLRAGHESALTRREVRELPATSGPPKVPAERGAASDVRSVGNADVATILATLTRDPSLRFSDPGRRLLQFLHRYLVRMAEVTTIAELIPDHCTGSVANVAREYARVWTELATQLEKRWR